MPGVSRSLTGYGGWSILNKWMTIGVSWTRRRRKIWLRISPARVRRAKLVSHWTGLKREKTFWWQELFFYVRSRRSALFAKSWSRSSLINKGFRWCIRWLNSSNTSSLSALHLALVLSLACLLWRSCEISCMLVMLDHIIIKPLGMLLAGALKYATEWRFERLVRLCRRG